MFDRDIERILEEWKEKQGRKPLVLRGARQVGKTSVVIHFAKKQFQNLIHLNLEKAPFAAAFQEIQPISDVLNYLEILTNTKITPGKTLLFIDEIQLSGIAMSQLRYFYE